MKRYEATGDVFLRLKTNSRILYPKVHLYTGLLFMKIGIGMRLSFDGFLEQVKLHHRKFALRVTLFHLGLLALPAAVSAQSPTCDINQIVTAATGQGWQQLNVVGQPCFLYFFNQTPTASWNTAQQQAQNLGFNLLSISGQTENDAIVAAAAAAGLTGGVWIGFTDAATEGQWVWADGTPNTFANWNPGEPSNSGGFPCYTDEDAAILQLNNGRWNDLALNNACPGAAQFSSVIKVHLCPEITAAGGGTVCIGDQANLSSSGQFGSTPYAYSWFVFPNPVPVAAGQNYAPTVNSTVTYVAAMQDAYGCADTAHVTVVANDCSNPDPPAGCDLPLITQTFVGAGCTPLSVCDDACSMYFYNPANLTGSQAQAFAQNYGANLISVQSQAENACIAGALVSNGFGGVIWIGFNDEAVEGTFVWYDQSPVTYTNWAGGEPNNSGNEDCTQIYPNGQWNDLPCNSGNSRSVIEVNLCPVVTITPSGPTTFCAGGNVTLTASTILGSFPYNYTWSPAAGLSATNVPNPVASPAQTTTYTVTSVDRYGCFEQQSVTVTVIPSPISTFTVSSPVCVGLPATITYTGNATAGATYNWGLDGGVPASGSGQGPYQVAWATEGAKNLTLQVTENGCTSAVEAVAATVSPNPVADFTFTTECAGDETVFTNTSTVSSGVIAASAWDFGAGPVQSTDATFTFGNAGTFPVTLGVVTAGGCIHQVTQQVTVNPVPTVNVTGTDVSCFGLCDGEAEAVVVGGTAPVSISWSNGAMGNTITGLCVGDIEATATDVNGCAQSDLVTIAQPAVLTAVVTPQTTTCPGVPNGTAIVVPSGGTTPYATDWGGEDPNALAEGTYDVTVTDANGCTVTESYTIAPGLGLVLDFAITDNVCFGGMDGQAVLTVTNGVMPYDIIWADAFGNPLQADLGGNGISTINGLATGVYNVIIEDAIGCISGSTIAITQPPLPLTLTLTPQHLSCFESGDGRVTAVQNGLSPFQYAISDIFGNVVGNTVNAGAHTFTGLDADVFFVTVTDNNGCQNTDTVLITEPLILEAESLVTQISCFGANDGMVQITSVAGGTTPYAPTTWAPMGQTGSTAINLLPGSVTTTVRDANGCELLINFLITQPLEMRLTPSYLTDTCGMGKGAAIVNASFGTPPYSYLWQTVNAGTDFRENNLGAGTYQVAVTDANGCIGTLEVTVNDDLPYPLAAFESRTEGETVMDQVVQFINGSVGTISYQWNFGDGTSSDQEDPRHRYKSAGDFLVQLLSSNGFCADTAYGYVNIDPLLALYIPNAFTPGINGINDFFFPQGEGIELDSYDMDIYDRWGKIVWRTSNFSKKWNGTHMSSQNPAPMGVYTYRITFRKFSDLDRFDVSGIVHLIRD